MPVVLSDLSGEIVEELRIHFPHFFILFRVESRQL